ncbi:Cobalt-zinc-cadmium resistance protein [Minicystis rosea]|nr:Cobalt-zinc-cadmium resistance protein [Minicystis rosea]
MRLAASVILLFGCGPAAAIPAPPPPSVSSSPATPPPAPEGVASATPSAVPEAPPPAPAPQPPPFPPPAFAPPVERTAKPGDGTWAPLVEGATGEPALLYRSTVHPDARKPQIYVALVAIDLSRVAIHLVAGTHEPLSTTVPAERRPGLVPANDLSALIAVFNGGFMARHGSWGMMIGGDVFLPPQEEGCTIALFPDGRVGIGTHSTIAPKLGDVVAYRQTPPCLLEHGETQPALLGSEKPRRWGMSETGGVDIRRSALGLAPGGRTLIYGLGESITPRQMAEAMRAAGAVDAAQIDVNWSYTRFLLYGKPAAPGAPPEVTATLIPKIKHGARQYVAKPADRDFFYLTRKP